MGDVLLGTNRPCRTPLMWEWRFRIAGEPFHHSPQLAIRDGKWKLYLNPDGSRIELYDLATDLTLLKNVAEHHADVVAVLKSGAGVVEAAAARAIRGPGR